MMNKFITLILALLLLTGCMATFDPNADIIGTSPPTYWSLDRDTNVLCFAATHSEDIECYRLQPLEKRNEVKPSEK